MYCFILKNPYNTNMKKKILIISAILAYGIGMFLVGNYIGATNMQTVATTDNPQKANEIQDALTIFTRPTIRYVDGSKYMIAIFGTNKNKVDYAAVELVEKGIITDDVGINSNVDNLYADITSTKQEKRERLEQKLNKRMSQRLSHIDGIYSAKTDIKLLVPTFFTDSQPSTASITIKTNKAFDLDRISNNVKNTLTASVPGLSKENIKINFEYEECDNECLARTYYGQARRAINFDKDYEKALTNLQKASKLLPGDLYATNDLKKFIDLTKKISKNPKDYKLYIERGDLQNIEAYSMFSNNITSDYQGAIEDYQKALALNPKAYEVYEKLGDAYSEVGWRKCDYCKLERDRQDDYYAIEYYQKAIKYTTQNDKLYTKLANRYYEVNDYENALKYYEKLKNIYTKHPQFVPYPDGVNKTATPIKMLISYKKTKQYKKAIEFCDEILPHFERKDDINFIKKQQRIMKIKNSFSNEN